MGMIDAEILRNQFLIFLQFAGFTSEDAAAGVEDDRGVSDIEREFEILLNEHDGLPFLL